MSGHSKWATIKHKKGAADAKRGKLFAKLIKQVEVAARQGGGDPDANPTLRTMFQKARDNSVPLDTIERAVKRGTGELEGVNYETITYEGYAPGGIALLIECLTDNRNRTSGDVRSTLSKNGGSLAEPGAVSWQFERKGVILVPSSVEEDEVMLVALDAGAEDIVDEGEMWRVTTPPSDLPQVREALDEAGIAVESADLAMLPTSTVEVTDVAQVKGLMKLMDLLDDLDDVQDVHGNMDVSDDLMDTVTFSTSPNRLLSVPARRATAMTASPRASALAHAAPIRGSAGDEMTAGRTWHLRSQASGAQTPSATLSRRCRSTAAIPRQVEVRPIVHATAPIAIVVVAVPYTAPEAWAYEIAMRGRVINPDACWAAAVDVTFPERRSTNESPISRNPGSTHNIRSHHCRVGKNQPPTSGPTMRFTISE